MILTKEIEIKITNNNLDYYKSKNYVCYLKDVINVKVIDVHINSGREILVKCDICGNERSLSIRKYWKNYKNHNFYSCINCREVKKIMTNLKKYGEKHPMLVYEFKERYKQTCLNKYGGYYVESDEFKNKSKETCLIKYHKDNYSKTDEYKEKVKKTCRNRYNFDSFSKTIEFKNKVVKTCLSKYGKSNPMKVLKFKEKSRVSRENMGLQSSDLTVYNVYKNKVRTFTNRNKKILFENWDGYDYYDNEYIKDFLELEHINVKFPTIDHKISVLYGYLNDISPEEISNIDNLCITKRCINSSKGSKCEKEFIDLV